jgi:hypothetical protein
MDLQLNLTKSPLTEVDPQAVDLLYDKDPESLSDPDLDLLIADLRAKREAWEANENKPKASAKVSLNDQLNINLDDLDIKL